MWMLLYPYLYKIIICQQHPNINAKNVNNYTICLKEKIKDIFFPIALINIIKKTILLSQSNDHELNL
jgi:hypothetical protein